MPKMKIVRLGENPKGRDKNLDREYESVWFHRELYLPCSPPLKPSSTCVSANRTLIMLPRSSRWVFSIQCSVELLLLSWTMNSLFNNTCKSYMRQLISTLRLVFILKGYKIENNYVNIIHKYFLYVVLSTWDIFPIDT